MKKIEFSFGKILASDFFHISLHRNFSHSCHIFNLF